DGAKAVPAGEEGAAAAGRRANRPSEAVAPTTAEAFRKLRREKGSAGGFDIGNGPGVVRRAGGSSCPRRPGDKGKARCGRRSGRPSACGGRSGGGWCVGPDGGEGRKFLHIKIPLRVGNLDAL